MNDSRHVAFGKPTQLGQLLQQVVRRKGLAEESALQGLEDLWRQTAGDRVAARSRVRKLRAGVLEIGVTHGAILEELNGFLQHELLPQLQSKHPTPPINALKFVKIN